MKYDSEKAGQYWSLRKKTSDDENAVLSLGQDTIINKCYADWEEKILFNTLGDVEGKTILDLACGVGRITKLLLQHKATVTGIDISEIMLETCKSNMTGIADLNNNFELIRSSSTSIPIKDEFFDNVICVGLLEHLTEEVRYVTLSEIIRVLKTNSFALLTVNNNKSIFLKRYERYNISKQLDNGYFCSLVDLDKIISFINDSGCGVEIISFNPIYSILKNFINLCEIDINKKNNDIIEWFFTLARENDIYSNVNKCSNYAQFNDHFIIKIIK